MNTLPFRWVWGCNFEFISDPGERPIVVCMVAKDLLGGRVIRLWHDEMPATPPFPIGDDSLFVSFAATAELGCFLRLGWAAPARVLDLHFEYLAKINGRRIPLGDGLLAALAAHGIPSITKEAKAAGRPLAMRGGPWTAAEQQEVLDYCQTDVDPLGPLLQRMLPGIRSRPKGLGQALLRGRYAAAVAHMEHWGAPLDAPLLERLRASWDAIKLRLVAEVDQDYGIYEGGTFKTARFSAWLKRQGIPWPVTETGAPSLEQDTFHEIARGYPQVGPLGDLRHAMGKFRLESLSVGGDRRNRVSVRDQCKACVLGANYGMGYRTLAIRIGSTVKFAKHLLKTMAERYQVHTKWAESVIGAGYMAGRLSTVFGWPMQVGTHTRQTTVVNYPMQAGGAEMLRIASCLATERGVRVCGPIHDALLVEADKDTAEQEIATCQAAMAEASSAVLGGMEIRTDAEVVRWPDRYMDKRGIVMWQRVIKLLETVEREREGRWVGRSVGIDILRKLSAAAEADSIAENDLVKSVREGVFESIRSQESGDSDALLPSNLPTYLPLSRKELP